MLVRYLWPALFTLALSGAVIGSSMAHRLYLRLCLVQLDPLGIGRFVPPGDRPNGKRVVFLGDSRAAQWPAPEVGADAVYINRGISGQTTAQILGRFGQHVTPLIPDVVVLQAGSNDLKCIPLFPERAEEIEQSCLQNLREIVARCVDSGSTVVLTTIFPHGRIPLYRRPIFDSRVTSATNRVNEQLRRLAGPHVLILDTAPILAGPDGLARSDFARDLLHLSAAGYAALNAQLVPLVTEALKSREPAKDERAPLPK